jgi:hypothetical protein
VLVHERGAELGGVDGTANGLDLSHLASWDFFANKYAGFFAFKYE